MTPDLIPLSDGRHGLRTTLQVTIREPSDTQPSTLAPQPVLEFVASSATLDRYREIIEPAGWRLENYRRNPVILNSHNYGDIIYTLGKALVTEVRAGALYQRIEFATAVNPLARVAYGLYRGGFLNAVSVGFIPLRWENGESKGFSAEHLDNHQLSSINHQPSGSSVHQLSTINHQLASRGLPFRRKYLEQELLEVSAVSIPANPDALQLAVKSGAVGRADLEDSLDLLSTLTRASQLSALHSQLFLLRQLQRVMHNA